MLVQAAKRIEDIRFDRKQMQEKQESGEKTTTDTSGGFWL